MPEEQKPFGDRKDYPPVNSPEGQAFIQAHLQKLIRQGVVVPEDVRKQREAEAASQGQKGTEG